MSRTSTPAVLSAGSIPSSGAPGSWMVKAGSSCRRGSTASAARPATASNAATSSFVLLVVLTDPPGRVRADSTGRPRGGSRKTAGLQEQGGAAAAATACAVRCVVTPTPARRCGTTRFGHNRLAQMLVIVVLDARAWTLPRTWMDHRQPRRKGRRSPRGTRRRRAPTSSSGSAASSTAPSRTSSASTRRRSGCRRSISCARAASRTASASAPSRAAASPPIHGICRSPRRAWTSSCCRTCSSSARIRTRSCARPSGC